MPPETIFATLPELKPQPPEAPTEAPLQLESVVCCLCGVEDVEPVAVGEDFEYRTCRDSFLMVKCLRCGLHFLNPRPVEKEFSRIYPNDYHAFQFDAEQFGLVYRVRRRIDLDRLRMWCGGLPKNARILDVGCGDGFHLRMLQSFARPGWSLEGIDADSRAVEAARKSGLSVSQGRIESMALPTNHYDLVLLIMTIEHVGDPVSFLQRIRELLRPGGKLVIITDNTDSPDYTLFGGRHWGGYHFPRHWNLFSPRTLRLLAEKSDYRVERLATSFSPVNWVYSIRNLLVDYGAPNWLVNQFSLKSALSLAAGTFLDVLLNVLHRGAILFARFQKPFEDSLR
jgi:SAM-dependent methyltransferase